MIEIKKEKKFFDTVKFYFDMRMLKILLLGAISGFPWVIIGSSLSLWLKEEGLSRSTIGWAGLIFAVYAFNYFWAPLIDRIQIPFLTKKIGHRKSWIFLMQIIILIGLIFWSFINPVQNLNLVIGAGLIIALASATQDITVDALRIEQIKKEEKEAMAAGAAVAVVGWWSGYKLGGVIALTLADFLENLGIENYWQLSFLGLGIIIILLNIGLFFKSEDASPPTLTMLDDSKDRQINITNESDDKTSVKDNLVLRLDKDFIGTIDLNAFITVTNNNKFSSATDVLKFNVSPVADTPVITLTDRSTIDGVDVEGLEDLPIRIFKTENGDSILSVTSGDLKNTETLSLILKKNIVLSDGSFVSVNYLDAETSSNIGEAIQYDFGSGLEDALEFLEFDKEFLALHPLQDKPPLNMQYVVHQQQHNLHPMI